MTARILITGSRTWTAASILRTELALWHRAYPGAVLVHGAARGADLIAAGIWLGWHLPVEPHPPTGPPSAGRPGSSVTG
jgi:SLOG family YspA-like protein